MNDRRYHRTRFLQLVSMILELIIGRVRIPVVLGLDPVTKAATPGYESEGADV